MALSRVQTSAKQRPLIQWSLIQNHIKQLRFSQIPATLTHLIKINVLIPTKLNSQKTHTHTHNVLYLSLHLDPQQKLQGSILGSDTSSILIFVEICSAAYWLQTNQPSHRHKGKVISHLRLTANKVFHLPCLLPGYAASRLAHRQHVVKTSQIFKSLSLSQGKFIVKKNNYRNRYN